MDNPPVPSDEAMHKMHEEWSSQYRDGIDFASFAFDNLFRTLFRKKKEIPKGIQPLMEGLDKRTQELILKAFEIGVRYEW
jgi:hypothetical protein